MTTYQEIAIPDFRISWNDIQTLRTKYGNYVSEWTIGENSGEDPLLGLMGSLRPEYNPGFFLLLKGNWRKGEDFIPLQAHKLLDGYWCPESLVSLVPSTTLLLQYKPASLIPQFAEFIEYHRTLESLEKIGW